jgi:uncharacterized protein (TIGR02391 family)
MQPAAWTSWPATTERTPEMHPRPLPKELLKKMILKTIWEHTRPNGKLASMSRGMDSILHPAQSSLAYLFDLTNTDPNIRSKWSLTEEERRRGLQAAEELQRDGFILNDPDQGNPVFKVLTEKGQKCVEQDLANMSLPVVDIDAALSRKDLADVVRDDYLNGKYEVAIRSAMQMVEEAVRAKARQPTSAYGANLLRTVFAPNNGVLRHPDAGSNSEKEALLNLFLGVNGWYRNPPSHRTVGYQDPHEVAQILGLANLLLTLVDECV